MNFQEFPDSSNIEKVGYDEKTQILGVTFKGTSAGKLYLYPGVPQNVHQEFVKAESVGSFFSSRIKDSYDHTQVTL